jgi:hypothetical protein
VRLLPMRLKLGTCSGVQRAWFSTYQEESGDPRPCVAIAQEPEVTDPKAVLQSIVGPLMLVAAESTPGPIRYSGDTMRDELRSFTYFVVDDGQRAQRSAGAGAAFYPT